MHPTIKFAAEGSKNSVSFLDVTVSLIKEVTVTDLYFKLTDSHQYLQSSLCHSFHCRKGIPYSQAFKLNCICSETNSFDKRHNVWKDFSWKEDTVLNWWEKKKFGQEKFQKMNC